MDINVSTPKESQVQWLDSVALNLSSSAKETRGLARTFQDGPLGGIMWHGPAAAAATNQAREIGATVSKLAQIYQDAADASKKFSAAITEAIGDIKAAKAKLKGINDQMRERYAKDKVVFMGGAGPDTFSMTDDATLKVFTDYKTLVFDLNSNGGGLYQGGGDSSQFNKPLTVPGDDTATRKADLIKFGDERKGDAQTIVNHVRNDVLPKLERAHQAYLKAAKAVVSDTNALKKDVGARAKDPSASFAVSNDSMKSFKRWVDHWAPPHQHAAPHGSTPGGHKTSGSSVHTSPPHAAPSASGSHHTSTGDASKAADHTKPPKAHGSEGGSSHTHDPGHGTGAPDPKPTPSDPGTGGGTTDPGDGGGTTPDPTPSDPGTGGGTTDPGDGGTGTPDPTPSDPGTGGGTTDPGDGGGSTPDPTPSDPGTGGGTTDPGDGGTGTPDPTRSDPGTGGGTMDPGDGGSTPDPTTDPSDPDGSTTTDPGDGSGDDVPAADGSATDGSSVTTIDYSDIEDVRAES